MVFRCNLETIQSAAASVAASSAAAVALVNGGQRPLPLARRDALVGNNVSAGMQVGSMRLTKRTQRQKAPHIASSLLTSLLTPTRRHTTVGTCHCAFKHRHVLHKQCQKKLSCVLLHVPALQKARPQLVLLLIINAGASPFAACFRPFDL